MKPLSYLIRGLLPSSVALKITMSLAGAWAYAHQTGQREMFMDGLTYVPKLLFDLVASAVTPGGDQE